MSHIIRHASARWDEYSNPSNPGWVVDVTFPDGAEETYAAAPQVYHAPESSNPEHILAATLSWEHLEWPADVCPYCDAELDSINYADGHCYCCGNDISITGPTPT